MRFYGLGRRETLELPINFFWFANSVIDRLNAEADLRQSRLHSLPMASEEYHNTVTERLIAEMGVVVKFDGIAPSVLDEERDEAGFEELRLLA